ncbi:hypothetical protein SKAU_G00122150 [Synaphobranchus kaupii]|uniref:Jun-like transcription factor domain-containing protein n=1 Tax=Synaphobranchus kaupii TaxID=118154 RepID=A0A9Q1FP00_SYNKA|nr:hypothetical protein SKAU_G00122150 [Synaphobranchus kaupii]
MNLNLTEPYRNLKSQLRAETDFYPASTEDVGSLKLASPELERLIIQNSNGVITTTPTPAQYLYARGITEEQEGFAEGFVKALDELHKMNQMPPPNVSIGAGGVTTCTAAPSVFGASLQPELPVYTTLNACPSNTNLTSASNYPQPQSATCLITSTTITKQRRTVRSFFSIRCLDKGYTSSDSWL